MNAQNPSIWELVFIVFVFVWYVVTIYVGVRVGKGPKWPLSKEATLAVGIVLICQWILANIWLYQIPSRECFELVAEKMLFLFVFVPLYLGALWGWIYLKIIK
jgi:hypothetical protein